MLPTNNAFRKDLDGNQQAVDELLRESLQPLFERENFGDQPVTIGIPGTHCLGRFFDLPAPDEERFADAVSYERQARIPLQPDEVCSDYAWRDVRDGASAVSDDSLGMRRVVLTAASKQLVVRRREWLDGHVEAPLQIQSDCVALHNALAQRVGDGEQPNQAPIAVLEVGQTSSNLLVCWRGGVWFWGLYQGTAGFDRALIDECQLTVEAAQQLRERMETAQPMHKVDGLLSEPFDELATAVRRTLDRWQQQYDQPVKGLQLCGGGAYQFGLLRFLRYGR